MLTALVTVTLVPWYGITHGYSAGIWAFAAFFLAANEMSITSGYHRLWAHKAYRGASRPACVVPDLRHHGAAEQRLAWCSGHRRHHLHVDDNEKDPYSSGRGFWFSHIGWMLRDYKSGEVDFSNIPDLKRDQMLAFQHRYYAPLAIASNFGLPLLVGWRWATSGALLLTGVARLVLSHHFTFFINSLAHMWGSRPYSEDKHRPRQCGAGAGDLGEGYHNFHHIFAHDYRNGARWWQWDPTKWLISACSWVGLTRRLKVTPAFQIQRALLAVQLSRAQQKLALLPDAHRRPTHIAQLRSKITQEYEALATAVADWTRVKEQWLEEKKRAVIDHWEQASSRPACVRSSSA